VVAEGFHAADEAAGEVLLVALIEMRSAQVLAVGGVVWQVVPSDLD
jgi:hypothetical protein